MHSSGNDALDTYTQHHRVDTKNPHHFFKGAHIISDQISQASLAVVWEELSRVLTNTVAGDIVEFGCYVGTTSLFIRRRLDLEQKPNKRAFHVYDSFQGLPPKTLPDTSVAGEQFQQGKLQVGRNELFAQFKRANLQPPIVHKAWFKDLQPVDVPKTIAFAFLDGDFYDSIRDSLQLVLPRMTQGSVILIDDYAHEALPGVAKAVREFLPQHLQQSLQATHNLGIIRL